MTPKKKKSTRFEVIQRTNQVVSLLLDGLERYEITQFASNEWGVGQRQVDDYLKWANKRIQRQAERDDREMFYYVKRRLQRQYRRAVQKKDGQLARLLLKDMRDLYGFDKPAKHALTDIEGNDLGIIAIPSEKANGKLNGRQDRLAAPKRKAIRSPDDESV